MGRVRRWVLVMPILLLAGACGDPIPGAQETLAAAEVTGPEAALEPSTTSTAAPPQPTTPTTHVTTTTQRLPPATTATTARRTQTSKVPVGPIPTIAGYAPAPPPPGVEPDGYGGFGGVTSTSAGGITVELSVYAREQYFGSVTQVHVAVAHPLDWAITAITVDYGNGHVVNTTPLPRWYCGSPHDAPASAAYSYPTAGRFRVTATATAQPCMEVVGGPGGWVVIGEGPPGVPRRAQTVSAGMDVLQRPDRPPLPVGPAPGP
jgi:hypothetical protein